MRCGKGGASACAALALLLLARGLAFERPSSCRALEVAYSRNSDGSTRAERWVSVYGHTRTLEVAHDGRAPSRAAAALLAAGLRARLRCQRVHLAPPSHGVTSDMCGLAYRMQDRCEDMDYIDDLYNSLVLAPAIAWTGERCEWFEACLKAKEVPPRMQVLGTGAAPTQLRLHVHLAAAADARAACRHAVLWDFYTDHTRLRNCSFVRDDKSESTLATVYTLPNCTVKSDFNNRTANAGLYLKMTILKDYAHPRSELIRLLTERQSSFLFIDYDIWDDMPGVYKVQPPPPTNFSKSMALDPMRSLRLADDFILRQLAPETLQALQQFSPTVKDIREVLEIEARSPHLGIEEAACAWALKHNATFESWYQKEYISQHSIAVFLCENDPDKHEYKNVAKAVENMHRLDSDLNIDIYFVDIDCRNEDHLGNEFIKTANSYGWQRLIGVVGAGAGARLAAEHAPGLQTALVLYDVPVGRTRLGTNARAVSGTTHQLAKAVQAFLDLYGWTRLALLSDSTELARDLYEAFQCDHKFEVYNTLVSSNVSDTLLSLQSLNARIFFVNTNPDMAQIILCAAHRLGMTSSAEYVWILREWRAVDLHCEETVSYKPNISHFTISFWWRGGNHTQIAPLIDDDENILRSTLDKLWPGYTWPPLAAPLADSLAFLIKSFKKFVELYPEKYFDLHGSGSARLLLNSLKNHPTKGIIQNFEYANGTLSQPFIFMDRWIGKTLEPILVWSSQAGRIKLIMNISEVYGKDWPSDGAQFCLTHTSNESFNPMCYDSLWFTALGLLVVVFLIFFISLRLRLKRLAKRDALLTAQLLAQREFVSSALADHYVDRAALELYDYIGHACFGRVRYAILRAPERQPISVAVKQLRDDVPLTEESELLREACTLATLSHDHIVRLVGVCATGGPVLVLMEYAFFGNLREYLCERRHLVERAPEIEENEEAYHVSAPSLTRLATEAASALAYLALQRLVHRDVRARNCLVDARRSLKLADFRLARKTGLGAAGEEEYLTRRRGLFPVLWMAPESLERGVFTAASDAWGLGVLLLELVTLGARPYGAWPPLRVLQYVSAGGIPPLPPDVSESTRHILVQCWRRAPEARATAASLVALLAADSEALRPALLPVEPPADEDCPAILDDITAISVSAT